MPDRKAVISHLQIIHTWASFARERDLQFFTEKHLEKIEQWTDDTLKLLKEQDNCENCAIAIEDRQPVIRCKDCKHRSDKMYDYYGNTNNKVYVCQINDLAKKSNWFCADGKRR